MLIARAIAQGADHLILDEPTNHLDIRYQMEILELVAGLGVTVLAALHDLSLAALFCDTVYLLADGLIVTGGTPESVITTEMVRHAYGADVLIVEHPETGTPHLIPRRSDRPIELRLDAADGSSALGRSRIDRLPRLHDSAAHSVATKGTFHALSPRQRRRHRPRNPRGRHRLAGASRRSGIARVSRGRPAAVCRALPAASAAASRDLSGHHHQLRDVDHLHQGTRPGPCPTTSTPPRTCWPSGSSRTWSGDFGVTGDGPVGKPVPTEYLAAFHKVKDISSDYFTLEKLVGLHPDFLFAGWNYGLSVGHQPDPDRFGQVRHQDPGPHRVVRPRPDVQETREHRRTPTRT